MQLAEISSSTSVTSTEYTPKSFSDGFVSISLDLESNNRKNILFKIYAFCKRIQYIWYTWNITCMWHWEARQKHEQYKGCCFPSVTWPFPCLPHSIDSRAGNQGDLQKFTSLLVYWEGGKPLPSHFSLCLRHSVFHSPQFIFSVCIMYSLIALLFSPNSVSIWWSFIVLWPDKFRRVILLRSFKSHINETLFINPKFDFICACMTKANKGKNNTAKHPLPKQVTSGHLA